MSIDNLVWAEKYRPTTLADVILPESTKKMIQEAISGNNIPNLLLHGSAGTGKTTICKVIANDLGADLLYINASLERSIDIIRDRVTSFSSSVSFSGGAKIVLFDECLHEDEKVRIGTVDDWTAIPLNQLQKDTVYPVVSFNMQTGQFENDTGVVISDRDDEIFEVKLSSGKTVRANSKHPFICEAEDGTFYERTIEHGLIGHKVVTA